jgi:hypothetical protein
MILLYRVSESHTKKPPQLRGAAMYGAQVLPEAGAVALHTTTDSLTPPSPRFRALYAFRSKYRSFPVTIISLILPLCLFCQLAGLDIPSTPHGVAACGFDTIMLT